MQCIPPPCLPCILVLTCQLVDSPCLQLKMQEAFGEHRLLVCELCCMPVGTLHEVSWMRGGGGLHIIACITCGFAELQVRRTD